MTEEEARAWLIDRLAVSRGRLDHLQQLEIAIVAANTHQNLIAESTIPHFWARHIVDSAQLLALAAGQPGPWIDLGSGAGFPGLVIALLDPNRSVTLVESRRKRAEHLEEMVTLLGLKTRVSICLAKAEQFKPAPYAVISARAFAPLDRLLTTAHHLSDTRTLWLLPKGRSARSELEAIAGTWQGSFRIEPSVTDPDGAIIIATDIQPRRRR